MYIVRQHSLPSSQPAKEHFRMVPRTATARAIVTTDLIGGILPLTVSGNCFCRKVGVGCSGKRNRC